MRILLAEDDPDLSRQLKQALSDADYAVDHAPDGEEAHFLGDTEPYDAVILDLGLPKKPCPPHKPPAFAPCCAAQRGMPRRRCPAAACASIRARPAPR